MEIYGEEIPGKRARRKYNDQPFLACGSKHCRTHCRFIANPTRVVNWTEYWDICLVMTFLHFGIGNLDNSQSQSNLSGVSRFFFRMVSPISILRNVWYFFLFSICFSDLFLIISNSPIVFMQRLAEKVLCELSRNNILTKFVMEIFFFRVWCKIYTSEFV